MFCSKCGKQIDDSAAYCSGCGNAVSRQPSSDYPQSPPSYTPNYQPSYPLYPQINRTPHHGKSVTALIFGIISAFFGFLFFLLTVVISVPAPGAAIAFLAFFGGFAIAGLCLSIYARTGGGGNKNFILTDIILNSVALSFYIVMFIISLATYA